MEEIIIDRTCSLDSGGKKCVVQKLWWGTSQKCSLGRMRKKWEKKVMISVKLIGFEDGRRVKLVQDHVWWWILVLMVLNLQLPLS